MELSIHFNTERILEQVGRLATTGALWRELALLAHDCGYQHLHKALVMDTFQAEGKGLLVDIDLL